jgi:hypothetical protein
VKRKNVGTENNLLNISDSYSAAPVEMVSKDGRRARNFRSADKHGGAANMALFPVALNHV